MAHVHIIVDHDKHFIIDPITKKIQPENPEKNKLVRYDHNSERYTFEMDRMLEGHDMSLCDIVQIHYINVSSNKQKKNEDIYEVNDLGLLSGNEDRIAFTWLVSRNATMLDGILTFAIRFACSNGDSIDYELHTEIFSSISISNTIINNGQSIVEEYSDILNQWKKELFGIEGTIQTAKRESLAAIDKNRTDSLNAINSDSRKAIDAINSDSRKAIDAINFARESSLEAIDRYGLVQVSEEDPTNPNIDVHINPNTTESFTVPEIIDDSIGPEDTWSSEKINTELSKVNTDVTALKEDLGNLREIEFYPNLLNKAEFLDGKQMVVSAGSTPDDLADNENTVTTNIINCDGDEYFETNLPNGHTVILAYFWYQEKWYRSQFINSLEVEGNHFKFKINAQMKKIRIYCTSNMMPANPILTKQGEYDESKPEFFPKGKIKLTPSGCVGYNNLDEETKQRINNKNSQIPSDCSEYIPFYGKKIVGIGDSIMVGIKSDGSAIIDGIGKNGLPCTDQGYQINSTGGFLGELRKKYPSINVVNMGVGSTTMQRNDNVNVNKVYKCIMDRIDSIPDDADIIILEGGINDFFHASKGCVLGTYKDNLYKYPTSAKYENGAYSYVEFAVDTTLDASTFCGALEIALTKILVRFVGKPFIYVIPHNPSASADIDTFFNSAKEICEKYGVPVVDIRKAGCMPRIYTLSGKTDGTSAFTQDGVHPNPLGYQLHYVPAIASTLKSIM